MTIQDEASARYPYTAATDDPALIATRIRQQEAFTEGVAWARKEALREAEDMFRAEDHYFHTHEAAYAVHLLAEGRDWFRWREEPSPAAWDACETYIEEIA